MVRVRQERRPAEPGRDLQDDRARCRAGGADRSESPVGRTGRWHWVPSPSATTAAYVVYSISSAGSDWVEWHVREVGTSRDLPDVVRWSKFSGAAWLHDGSGFFYSRYEAPAAEHAYSGVNRNQQVFFHALGTPQASDTLVYARPDQPDWGFAASVTEDGSYLVLTQWEGTHRESRVFVRDLRIPGSPIEPFLDRFDASYSVVGSDGPLFYVLTDKAAGRNRLVAIDLAWPAPDRWRTLIPELPGRDVLTGVAMVGERFLTVIRSDAHDRLLVHGKDGAFEREVTLPALGSIAGISGKRGDPDAFYAFTAFTFPTTVHRYDPSTGQSDIFKAPTVAFAPGDYEATQVFYSSKDGTRIPMFVTVQRKGLRRTGDTPTLLYGYGGFDISLHAAFSPGRSSGSRWAACMRMPNLRGGGEYGEEWHEAGTQGQQAERVRRFHRRGRVPDRRRLHFARDSSRSRRQQRRAAGRRRA